MSSLICLEKINLRTSFTLFCKLKSSSVSFTICTYTPLFFPHFTVVETWQNIIIFQVSFDLQFYTV